MTVGESRAIIRSVRVRVRRCVCVYACVSMITQKPLEVSSPIKPRRFGDGMASPGHSLFLVAIRILSWILHNFPGFFGIRR